MNDSKKPWQSKSIWVGLIMAAAPLIPGGSDFIAHNPDLVTSLSGILMIVLRLVTSKGVGA